LPRDIARLAKFSHNLLALKVSDYSNDPVECESGNPAEIRQVLQFRKPERTMSKQQMKKLLELLVLPGALSAIALTCWLVPWPSLAAQETGPKEVQRPKNFSAASPWGAI
jgi:hypothetical protein